MSMYVYVNIHTILRITTPISVALLNLNDMCPKYTGGPGPHLGLSRSQIWTGFDPHDHT